MELFAFKYVPFLALIRRYSRKSMCNTSRKCGRLSVVKYVTRGNERSEMNFSRQSCTTFYMLCFVSILSIVHCSFVIGIDISIVSRLLFIIMYCVIRLRNALFSVRVRFSLMSVAVINKILP